MSTRSPISASIANHADWFFVQYFLPAILWLHDRYVDVRWFLNQWPEIFVVLCAIFRVIYSALMPTKSRSIIFAMGCASRVDRTWAVRLYYATHSDCFIGDFYRWLARFGNKDRYIDIIYSRGINIIHSRIDLEEDMEVLTSCSLYEGSVTLDELPGKAVMLR